MSLFKINVVRWYTLALAAVMALVLAGCGSTSKVTAAPAAGAVPDWVVNGGKLSDAQNWYAVGQGKMPTEQTSLKMARMQARAELASIMSTQVKNLISAKQVMSNGAVKAQDFSQSVETLSEALLQGSEQAGRYIMPDGTVYVLMSLPKASAVQKLNEAAASITGKPEPFATVEDFNK